LGFIKALAFARGIRLESKAVVEIIKRYLKMQSLGFPRVAVCATGLAVWFIASIAAPVLGADGEPFESEGITLKSWLPLSAFPDNQERGNDIWGYVSPSGREYAIVGLWNGTAFVEVTDPDDATLVGYVPTPGSGSTWRDMRTYQEYAYSVSEGGFGIEVIDLTDIDNGSVEAVNLVNDDFTFSAHNIAVNPDSGYAYLVSTNNAQGFTAVDLSDPVNPVIGQSWTQSDLHDLLPISYTEGPYAGREIAFGFGGWSSDLWIIDVTDKSDMTVLSRTDYPNAEYCHQGWISGDRRYLFVNDELDELDNEDVNATTTHVFDVRDLENPVHVRAFNNGNTAIDHNLMVRGRYMIAANYTSGLRIFDVCDIFSAHEIAFFDTHPENDDRVFHGAWGVYANLPSGIVIVSDIDRGLFVFETDVNLVQEDTPPRIYVNQTAGIAGPGTTWENAASDLQAAMESARCSAGAVNEIWVTGGTYLPAGPQGPQNEAFELIEGVAIYGGFAGGETSLDQRDPVANPTILSGDRLGDDGENFTNTEENSFNIIEAVTVGPTTVLDGFTIYGGRTSTSGAGIKLTNASPTIRNCVIKGHQSQRGAGVYLSDGSSAHFEHCVFESNSAGISGGGGESVSSTPTFVDCIFRFNVAGSGGGGFGNGFGDATFDGCLFEGNRANLGGGFNNATANAAIRRCVFLENEANIFGGGVYNLQGDPVIENSLFLGNLAEKGAGLYSRFQAAPAIDGSTFFANVAENEGGGMFHGDSAPQIRNSVLWSNADGSDSLESGQVTFDDVTGGITYSCVEGWSGLIGGEGVIADDPAFRDAVGDDGVPGTGDEDLRLSAASPLIDQGDPNTDASGVDLIGHLRVLCDRIDMGAYESGVSDGDCDRDVDLVDFGLLQTCFGTGVAPVECQNFDTNVDGLVDLSDFAGFVEEVAAP
jgi:choice-of-anchor B domain-containing protein